MDEGEREQEEKRAARPGGLQQVQGQPAPRRFYSPPPTPDEDRRQSDREHSGDFPNSPAFLIFKESQRRFGRACEGSPGLIRRCAVRGVAETATFVVSSLFFFAISAQNPIFVLLY